MSMISEQIKELRRAGDARIYTGEICIPEMSNLFNQAADTIEALSAKLAAANMERSDRYYGGWWISCEDRLPEDFEVVLAFTEEKQIVTVARDGEDWVLYNQGIIKEKILAWQPLPEPYRQ